MRGGEGLAGDDLADAVGDPVEVVKGIRCLLLMACCVAPNAFLCAIKLSEDSVRGIRCLLRSTCCMAPGSSLSLESDPDFSRVRPDPVALGDAYSGLCSGGVGYAAAALSSFKAVVRSRSKSALALLYLCPEFSILSFFRRMIKSRRFGSRDSSSRRKSGMFPCDPSDGASLCPAVLRREFLWAIL